MNLYQVTILSSVLLSAPFLRGNADVAVSVLRMGFCLATFFGALEDYKKKKKWWQLLLIVFGALAFLFFAYQQLKG